MDVSLSPENEHFVRDALESGAYTDSAQVLDEALDLLRRKQALRRDVDAGIAQLDNGEVVPSDQMFDRLRRRVKNDSLPPGEAK